MTAEDAAWAALDEALQDYEPPCVGHDAFTADQLTEGERAWCAVLCARCPVFALCEAYATAASVRVGFWAGHAYTTKGRSRATPPTTDTADRTDSGNHTQQ